MVKFYQTNLKMSKKILIHFASLPLCLTKPTNSTGICSKAILRLRSDGRSQFAGGCCGSFAIGEIEVGNEPFSLID